MRPLQQFNSIALLGCAILGLYTQEVSFYLGVIVIALVHVANVVDVALSDFKVKHIIPEAPTVLHPREKASSSPAQRTRLKMTMNKMILKGKCDACKNLYSNPFVHACGRPRDIHNVLLWMSNFFAGMFVGFVLLAWLLGLPFEFQYVIYPVLFLVLALYIDLEAKRMMKKFKRGRNSKW